MGWDGPMTHRQFLAWNEYLYGEGRKPNLDHIYLMQIAMEIRRFMNGFSKSPPRVKLEDFEIKFVIVDKPKPFTPEQVKEKTAIAKAVWRQRLGM